jgi:hypothetical protein
MWRAGEMETTNDWKKLTDTVEYQKSWNTRDCMEDKTLRKFAEICKYFDLGDTRAINLENFKQGRGLDRLQPVVDVAIATIDGHLYLLIDWEEDDAAEETEKSIAFRIKTKN